MTSLFDVSTRRTRHVPGRRRHAEFDHQAATFEQRAGLPAGVCHAVARQAATIAGLAAGDLVLELGAGTGTIGRFLAAPPARYLGIDRSLGMLLEATGGELATRACADASSAWPVADHSVRLVFASRAIHLLASERVRRETLRVAHPRGAVLLIGRVARPRASARQRMVVELRRRLRAHGFETRGGNAREARLLDRLSSEGARAIPRQEIAAWTVHRPPAQTLAIWRAKPGLGGVDPDPRTRRAVLDAVEHWARRNLGDLAQPVEEREVYVLSGVCLPPDPRRS